MASLYRHDQNDNTPDSETPSIENHPVLSDIRAICTEIEQLEEWLKTAKQRLNEAVIELPTKVGNNEDLREEIVYHLYWFDDRVPKTTLRKAFNVVPPALAGKNSKNVIRARIVELTCYDCDQKFQVEARSSNYYGMAVCNGCQAKRNQSHIAQRQQYKAEQERIRELSTMPYYEYLKTPEWNERRKRAMKRAGYRCQVCNAYGVQLDTHHRTYERRGNEWDRDLITLCHACHEIFHANGQLAAWEGR